MTKEELEKKVEMLEERLTSVVWLMIETYRLNGMSPEQAKFIENVYYDICDGKGIYKKSQITS